MPYECLRYSRKLCIAVIFSATPSHPAGYPGPIEPNRPRAPSSRRAPSSPRPAVPALAFALSHTICSRCLSAQLTTRPLLTRFSIAAETLICAIHSIPALDPREHLSQLSFYLGRAGATSAHLSDRWRDHAAEQEHGHHYGMVLFRASTRRVLS